MEHNEFESKLEAARTPAEVLHLIHIDLPRLPAGDSQQLFLMAYGRLEATACTGEEGVRGGRGVVLAEEIL